MRLVRLPILALLAVAMLVLVVAGPASATGSSTTFKVLVGAENTHRGISVTSYFPRTIKIHVGDTVRWVQNANEIHTVTFLGGQTPPALILPAATPPPDGPSPLVINPVAAFPTVQAGLGDTTTFVNSGLMGFEQGQVRSFELTFTATGTYDYMCIVHGLMMSGRVTVVGDGVAIPSPNKDRARGQHQIARFMAKAPAVIRAAVKSITPSVKNADGSTTHFINLGYGKGKIDLMRFFPKRTLVRPDDKIVWQMTSHSDAPHTVTFLNGAPEPQLVEPVSPPVPPTLYINPAVFFSAAASDTLTRTGIYSSGLLQPMPGVKYEQTVGQIAVGQLRYECLLHDSSGMQGSLVVLPK